MAHDTLTWRVVLFGFAVAALAVDCSAGGQDAPGPQADGSPGQGSNPDGGIQANGEDSRADVPDATLGAGHFETGAPDATAQSTPATGEDAEAGVAETAAPSVTDATGPDDGGIAPDDGSVGGAAVKPRVVVMTDIGFDPDDQESLVRYLVYSNEFDTEALIAATSVYLRSNPREDLIRQEIAAYGQARPNLMKHASGFVDPASLLAVTKTGQSGYGMAFVGPGKSTAGSQQLIAAIDKPDVRPIWVTIWGGANTLAQAFQDVSTTRSAAELARFVAKVRVYSISDQDDAGAWLRRTFPQLFYIVSPSDQTPAAYPHATWTGISGDRWYKNGPLNKFDLVDNPWLQTNIIMNHGPLGAIYPPFRWIMEGDTPSYIGLVDNGLGWSTTPSYGGWGGRYSLLQPAGEPHPIWTNDNLTTRDTVVLGDGGTATSDQATIWRWREDFQNDFAARMNWCVADQFAKANHNPVAVLNGDGTKNVLTLPAKSGSTVTLAADGTIDPDGDRVDVTWWIYHEASTLTAPVSLSATNGLRTQLTVPVLQSPGTIHIIMQAVDSGSPRLFSYRRAVLLVTP